MMNMPFFQIAKPVKAAALFVIATAGIQAVAPTTAEAAIIVGVEQVSGQAFSCNGDSAWGDSGCYVNSVTTNAINDASGHASNVVDMHALVEEWAVFRFQIANSGNATEYDFFVDYRHNWPFLATHTAMILGPAATNASALDQLDFDSSTPGLLDSQFRWIHVSGPNNDGLYKSSAPGPTHHYVDIPDCGTGYSFQCTNIFDEVSGYTLDFMIGTNLSPPQPVPIPAAGWLFLSGLVGFSTLIRARK